MEGLRASGFVDGDNLLTEIGTHTVTITGNIGCLGGIVISVLKTLDRLGGKGQDAIVQTVTYAYNVSIRGQHNIFRYDNLHDIKGYPDRHHKDLYDWRTNKRLLESPEWIGAERWPTLTDVICEARNWYYNHEHELEAPNEFPELEPPRGR